MANEASSPECHECGVHRCGECGALCLCDVTEIVGVRYGCDHCPDAPTSAPTTGEKA